MWEESSYDPHSRGADGEKTDRDWRKEKKREP